jgi:hypothetical protein
MRGATVFAGENDFHRKLDREALGEHRCEDAPERVGRHVARRPAHEFIDRRAIVQRQDRRLIAPKLADPSRGARAFVEKGDEANVDLRHLPPQVIDLELRLGHIGRLVLAPDAVTSSPCLLGVMRYASIVSSSSGAAVDRAELYALRDKYARMRAMRVAHAAGVERDDEVRAGMADLAARFPGALREIDELDFNEIERRIDRLGAVFAGTVAVERWMEAIALFHRFARGALCAKRWLNGRRIVTAEVASSFRRDIARLGFPDEAGEWEAHLDALAAPPGGRVTVLVYERVAMRLDVTVAEARALAFGESRRSR